MSTSVATPSALALAAENAATNRRSSASSATSDLDDLGIPVQPYHHHSVSPHHHHHLTIKAPSSYESDVPSASEPSSVSETSTLEPSMAATNSNGLRLALQSPTGEMTRTGFTFEEIMSPRHQNGKRYLGGCLTHRVSMAGGFLKSWKRKYFRLRDHGIVCFKNAEDTTPLFEIHFKAQSMVVVDQTSGGGSMANVKPNGDDPTMLASTKGKVNASLAFILKHVEIVGHRTPANKVDVPVFLKAENETEFCAWVEHARLKIEARKYALAQDAVDIALETNDHSGEVLKAKSGGGLSRHSSTGELVTSTERQGSTHLEEMPSRQEPRVSSMNRLPLSTRPANASPTSDRNRLLFVAGMIPDPPEFATFRSKYLLMKEIGEGSFSIVHRAVNRLTGQLCAVKCCKYSQALEEEVAIMRRLSHPNLVGLEGVYLQDEMYYVVMDYMEEGDLCERLIQKQRFTESEAKVIITQVVQGLEHLHRHNVLHRDLKPENILLHGEVVKIADFGLARQLPTATSMLKRSCGTLEYAAPELLRGQAYGLKSDIFSLGVVLYVLLFGAFPFTIESAAALQRMERFPEGVDVRDMSCLHKENSQWKQVSSLAQDVLLRMLCPSDKDRISTKELLEHPWFGTIPVDSGIRRGSGVMLQDQSVDEREAERVRDCRAKGFIELLSRGLDVIKYAKAGTTAPHIATLSIDFGHGTISWSARGGVLGVASVASNRKVTDNSNSGTMPSTSKRGMRVISFSDVEEVRVGHSTDAFRSVAKNGLDSPPEDVCLSIVATWRTLDIVVKAPAQREYIVTGLNMALEQYRIKHLQS